MSVFQNKFYLRKINVLVPSILFVLFMGESYENIEKDIDKNQFVVNFIKAQLVTYEE